MPALLDQVQICAYLRRLGLTEGIKTNLADLNRLLFAHLTHVPFDSLDVWGGGICPSLDVQDLYTKIVVNGRGGYCFEQNTLFRVLLNSLDFNAYQAVACLLNADYTPQPPAHNVIICYLDGKKYLLDVGFGGPVPYEALELTPHTSGKFRLSEKEGLYVLERSEEDGWRPFIQFRDIVAEITDLIPLNFYISQNPNSHFRHIIHLNQRKADGSTYVLDGTEFKIHKNGQVQTQRLCSIEELKQILREYYGIDPANCILRDTL